MRRSGTWGTLAVVIGVTLASVPGCSGGSPRPSVDLAELTTSYPCGYGFQAGNGAQTVGLFLVSDAPGAEPEAMTADLGDDDAAWSGEIQIGRHLFANWCNDVIDMNDPQPEVTETWTLVDGVVRVTDVDAGARTATMTVTGLVARDPSGTRHALGDVVVENTGWGTFAG